jgi:hypothetical protein
MIYVLVARTQKTVGPKLRRLGSHSSGIKKSRSLKEKSGCWQGYFNLYFNSLHLCLESVTLLQLADQVDVLLLGLLGGDASVSDSLPGAPFLSSGGLVEEGLSSARSRIRDVYFEDLNGGEDVPR